MEGYENRVMYLWEKMRFEVLTVQDYTTKSNVTR